MPDRPPRFAVFGSGSWGTAFAKVLADAGSEVTLWARRREVAEAIEERRENPEYLPGIRLPDRLVSTSDPRRALDGATAVVLAVPSQSLRHNLTAWRSLIKPDATLISLAKGMEQGTLKRMSQVITEVTGVDEDQVAVVSGPNLAEEIAEEQPTATVIACTRHERAVDIQRACATGYFRPYTITDVVGCELAGACKNVIALSCGMAAGLGFGSNSLGALVTRGLAEMARLGQVFGADPLTFAGLAGLGDLVATCLSPLSRNRTFGERLGRGQTPAQAQAAMHGQVAEGVKTCSAIRELARLHGIEMPITEVVHRVCHDGFDPRDMAADLIGRKTKPER
jgi:glycerol-3-phosphate dehydrogenase (NAD(P)+)